MRRRRWWSLGVAARVAVWAGLVLGASAGSAVAQGAVAQGAVAEPRPVDGGCVDLPVHTAALAERTQLAGLGGVPFRPPQGLAPASRAPWSPETRLSDRVVACLDTGRVGPIEVQHAGRLWAAPLPAALELRYASEYPLAMTDGSFRPGVGILAGAVGGGAAGLGPVTLIVRPEIHHHRNSDFRIAEQSQPGHSRFIHPTVGTRIDLPQRFGDTPFEVVSLGQTTLRLDWRGFAAGASTENAWWGPGLRNPLLLSSAAPGFPHAFVGTTRPVDVRIGTLHFRTLVGRLTESGYFDDDPDNDHQLLSGTILSFEPAPLPGLTLGAARFFAVRDGPDVGLGTFLRAAFTGLRENPGRGDPLADNQHASIFARWAFPDPGLAVYGEFARIDHWWRSLELITTPQAASAWMAGLQKVFAGEARAWRVMAEAASLVDPMPSQLPGRPGNIIWYTHTQLRQGHTHRGQLLGAPIGPGGRQQMVAIDRFSSAGDLGVELARTVYNDDSYNRIWWRYFRTFGHDAELSARIRGRQPVGPVDLHATLGYSRRWNRHFLGLAELIGTAWELDDLQRDGNMFLELRGVWTGW